MIGADFPKNIMQNNCINAIKTLVFQGSNEHKPPYLYQKFQK